jgi:hypothetical protein
MPWAVAVLKLSLAGKQVRPLKSFDTGIIKTVQWYQEKYKE